jgi:MFS family permease
MSELGTTMGRGRKRQMGGARFDGNPSSILGIPLGSKAQPAGLAVLVTILTIYTIDAMSGKRYGAALGLQVAIGIATVVAYIFAYSMTEGFGSWSMLFTIFIGVAVGMIYFALPAKYHPLDPEGSVNPSGEYSKCAAGVGGVGPNGGELVCDAYLNGERIGTVPT